MNELENRRSNGHMRLDNDGIGSRRRNFFDEAVSELDDKPERPRVALVSSRCVGFRIQQVHKPKVQSQMTTEENQHQLCGGEYETRGGICL